MENGYFVRYYFQIFVCVVSMYVCLRCYFRFLVQSCQRKLLNRLLRWNIHRLTTSYSQTAGGRFTCSCDNIMTSECATGFPSWLLLLLLLQEQLDTTIIIQLFSYAHEQLLHTHTGLGPLALLYLVSWMYVYPIKFRFQFFIRCNFLITIFRIFAFIYYCISWGTHKHTILFWMLNN